MEYELPFKYITGITGDILLVIDDYEKVINEYSLGYNASLTKQSAQYAHNDVLNAQKFHWKSPYVEKPFIGDLLPEGWEDMEWIGYNVFLQKPLSQKAIEEIKSNNIKERG